MQIRLINLDRSTDRLAEFTQANQHLDDVKRFAAIEGRHQDIAALTANGTFAPGIAEYYGPGAVGAALSHLALWETASAINQALTIAEDDAIFNRQFKPAAAAVIATLPADWDFILWGWNFDTYLLYELMPGVSPCLCCFDEEQMRAGASAFQEQKIAPQAFKLTRALGIPSYSVSPKGARALKAACLPLAKIKVFFPGLNRHLSNFGIDVMMNHVYPQLKAYVSFPPLVITKNEIKRSTIQTDIYSAKGR